MENGNTIPELRKNQFGISIKTFRKFNSPQIKDEILYFTVNKNDISMELYPLEPIMIIDKDALKMILNKINKIDITSKRSLKQIANKL
jgi:hypothetical protein